jgi:group II intron reverse transcriptase/maturase
MTALNEDLMEAMLSQENLEAAWRAVRTKRGAPGVDGITVEKFPEHIGPHVETLRTKLREQRYKPSPVKRVYIPKGNGKTRPLGIPTVQDRWLQQAMLQVLQPIFDPLFSAHSYGFRPGRCTHDAVKAARNFLVSGKTWVVDIDLASFFDEVNHDILMHRVAQVIRDKGMLRLIGRYLRCGVREDGRTTTTTKGVPQGGPLSPLLANIYLDALDRELESRGLSFCRYADDCNIYVGSERSARRVFESVTAWIEMHLRIPVNREKSDVGRPWERQFLGYQPTEEGDLQPAPKSLVKFKDRVRELFSGRLGLSGKDLRKEWRRFIIGWCDYYKYANQRWWRANLSGWVRHHMRKYAWLRWHNAQGRRNALRRLGVSESKLRSCPMHGKSWRTSRHPVMNSALNNTRLRQYGFWVPSDFTALPLVGTV